MKTPLSGSSLLRNWASVNELKISAPGWVNDEISIIGIILNS